MRTPCLVLSGLLLLSPAAAQNNDNTAGAPVITASATLEPDRVVLELLGSAQARASVSLYPEVEGEVAEVLFQAGQRVRAGQILVRLDDTQQRLAVQLAEAQWRVAQVVAQRLQATRGTGAVPDTEIDQAVAEARTREITLAQAREDLADRVLRAPFAGVVGIPAVERGDRVSRTTLVSTLDDRREILVDIDLPEAWLARVRVRAALDNADDRLRAGMSFQVRLVFEGEPLVSAPELALQFGNDGGYVWTVRDGKAEAVAAQVVRREDGRVRLRSALREGDTVVVEGVQRLRDGRAVRVVGQRNGDAR